MSPALAGRFLTIEARGKTNTHTHAYTHTCAKSLQLCPTLCNPMDCSLPVSSVHGILQARILEGVDFRALLQGIFFDPGIEPVSLTSPTLVDGFFITSATWETPERERERERGYMCIIYIHMYIYMHIYKHKETYVHIYPHFIFKLYSYRLKKTTILMF